MASQKSDTLLVAAIDFGTTYSGYAFSLRDKPTEIQIPQTWYAGSTQLASLKTPTCLLIPPKGEILFGYDAENKYAELAANYEHEDCYFFQHFKMILHNYKNLSKSTRIDDINGKSMQALKVFAHSIEFFKKHLMQTLDSSLSGVNLEDIHFVITVPAIWNDTAKQFMREAAVQAGLDNEKISLALEPEAASIFCQQVPTEKMVKSAKFEVAKAGTEYMVVDLGGGTADITVHRKEVDGSLKALHAATGGPWGGLQVNKEYLRFLTEIVGDDVMEKFKTEEMGDYFDVLRDFESKKRTITPEKEGSVVIRIPVSLKDFYEKQKKCSFEDAISKSRHGQHVSFLRDKIKVDIVFIRQLFHPTISSIVAHVEKLLLEPKMENVDRLLLVGGYSECGLVRGAFTEKFGEKRVICPHEAGFVVIKGAIYFGHNPSVISSRILSYTYGIESRPKFQEGTHLEEKKTFDAEGRSRCKDIFYVYKHAGDIAKLGEVVSCNRLPLSNSQNRLDFIVYVTKDQNPEYITDKGFINLGKLGIEIPPYTGEKRRVILDFVFGDTEFMVEATEDKTKKKSP